MATIHIHPTATTRRHIEAIQARTGLIAVLGGAGVQRCALGLSETNFTAFLAKLYCCSLFSFVFDQK